MSSSRIIPPTHLTPTATSANREQIPLHGLRLRLLQALWVILVLIVSSPAFYQVLHTVCTLLPANCESDQLTTQAVTALQHAGFSLHAYALAVFLWDLLTSLAFLLLGALIFWRKANTWMGLFVSFFLINFGSIGVSLEHSIVLGLVSSDNVLVLLASIVGQPLSILAYLY